jgi:hypothetical protein
MSASIVVFLVCRTVRVPDGTGKSCEGPKKTSCLAFWDEWDKKRCYFKKQSGEVTDNKDSATKNKPEQTGKQSGEVVENAFLWKKQS